MSQNKVVVQSRMDAELKHKAESIFAAMGISISEAIRLYFAQTVTDHALPFKPSLREPRLGLIAALKESREGKMEHFDNVDDWAASWKDENDDE